MDTKIVFVDGPFGIGTGTEVRGQKYQADKKGLTNIRYRGLDISPNRFGMKNGETVTPYTIHEACERAIQSVRNDVKEGISILCNTFVFNGSPFTYRAVGSYYGVRVEKETIDMLRNFALSIRERTLVILLHPSPILIPPKDISLAEMLKFSGILKGTYSSRDLPIQEIRVKTSPVTKIISDYRLKHSLHQNPLFDPSRYASS